MVGPALQGDPLLVGEIMALVNTGNAAEHAAAVAQGCLDYHYAHPEPLQAGGA